MWKVRASTIPAAGTLQVRPHEDSPTDMALPRELESQSPSRQVSSIEPTQTEQAHIFPSFQRLGKACPSLKTLNDTLYCFPGFRRLGRLRTFWHTLKCGRLGVPQSQQLALYRPFLMKTFPQTWLFPEYSRTEAPPDRCPASSPCGLNRS